MGVRSSEILRRERMDITLPTIVELFLATKQTEGRSPKTVSVYGDVLRRFCALVGEGVHLGQLGISHARAFVAWLQEKDTRYEDHPHRAPVAGGLSGATVHAHVRVLKTFATWLEAEGWTTKNAFDRLKRPKLPKPVIEILGDDEIDRLLGQVNPKCVLGARLYTIVLLLLDTGIRAGELCGLALPHVHVDEGYIKVCGKGDKERMVPFGSTTKKALLRWLITWRDALSEDTVNTAFVTNAGQPLTYTAVAQSLKRLSRRSGVPRLHAHLFRHTFAVRYLMNGGDIMTLQLMLGHTTLEVTQMYMHLAQAHIQVQHHKFSPVDRLDLGRRRRR